MATVLRIIDWDKHYEDRDHRRPLMRAKWVQMPLKRGTGYKRLMIKKNGPALFGAWVAVVEFAAQCFVRGLLCRESGEPYDATDIAVVIDFPEDLIQQVLELTRNEKEKIRWIEDVDHQIAMDLIAERQREIDEARAKSKVSKRKQTANSDETGFQSPSSIQNSGDNWSDNTKSREVLELHHSTSQNNTTQNNHSSPTSSQSAQQPVRSSTGEPATWAEVAEAMSRLKISRIQDGISAAKRHGFTPPQVLALIDVVGAAPKGATSPAGALWDRLNTPHAVNWDASEGWPWSSQSGANPPPPASPYDVPDEVSAADAKRREAEDLQRDRDFIAEMGRLELEHGATLNAMSGDDLQSLMATASQAAQAMLRRDYTAKGRDSPDVRPTLLRLIDNPKTL